MNNKLNGFYALSLIFVLMVPLGTLLHEGGHYFAAKFYESEPSLHHASVSHNLHIKEKQLTDSIVHALNLSEEQKKMMYDEVLQLRRESYLITLAGPLVNMGLGSIFFILLFFYSSNKHFHRQKWWFIFGSFLWSRQIINFMMGLLLFLFKGNWGKSDETKLSVYLNLPTYFFDLIFATLGSILLLVVFTKFMNRDERVAFVFAGAIGGGLSALIWFKTLGPWLLP